MKRIAYVFLSVAVMLVASGSFVSCKDYDEDVTTELKVEALETKTLLEELEDKVVGAEGLVTTVDKLEENLDKEINDLEDKITNDYVTKDELSQKITELAGLYATKTELASAKTELQNSINTAKTALQGEINGLAERITALEGKTSQLCACAEKITALQNDVKAIQDWKNNEFATWQSEVNTAINTTLPQNIATALAEAQAAKAEAAINAEAIKRDSLLIDSLSKVGVELVQADEDLNARIDSLRNAYNVAVDSINENILDLDSIVDTLTANVATTMQTVAELRTHIDTTIVKFNDSIAAIRGEINTIKANVEELTTKYNTLVGRVDKIENYLAHLISGILVQAVHNPVYGSFALPANVNNNMLAAYYGDLSRATKFPTARPSYYANSEATILSVKDLQMMGVSEGTIKAGRIVADGEDNAGTVYVTVNPTNIDFTGQTLEMVNSLDEDAHVTLAPLAKSSKKLTFGWSRAASNGFYEAKARIEADDVEKVKARVNLTEMKDALKDVLTPTNGVNVTKVVTSVASNFTNVLDANALRATWKNEIDGTDMAIYGQYSLAATAIKPLSYTFLQDLDVQQIPGIGRAEDLINRLFDKVSIEFGNAWPTIDLEKYYDFLDFRELKLDTLMTVNGSTEIDVKATVSVVAHIPDSVYKGQELIIWDKRDPNPNNWVALDTVKIYPSDGMDITGSGTALVKDTITFDVSIKEFIKDVNADFNEWILLTEQDLCDNLNSLLDELKQINDVAGKVDNALDDVQSTLISFLDKFNEKATNIINSANKVLQPVMLVKTNNGFARVSEVKSNPTLVSGTSMTLVPTSYTADVVAPPYKRLVGVTNVYNTTYSENAQEDGGACLAELNRVNELPVVAEVTNGTKTGISVTLNKGYIYEFAYTAVDYAGYVVAKKCYIAVK